MKKFELTVPKPCHENWEAMTPEDKGRFCGSCQKTVIDFSGMSDAQVAQFFKKPTGSVCGRFDGSQLNRVVEVPRKRLPWIKYFFTIALPAFLFSKKAAAQGEVRQTETKPKPEVCNQGLASKVLIRKPADPVKDTVPPIPRRMGEVGIEDVDTKLRVFKGKVINANGESVPYATVAAREEGRIVMADSTGCFSIKHSSFPLKLEITSIGYLIKEGTITDEGTSTITMERAEYLSGVVGMVVIKSVRKKKTPTAATQQKKAEPQKAETTSPTFTVYPNPVSSNSSFTLDAKELESDAYTMQLFTVSGDAVQTRELAIEKNGKQSIALGNVAAGTYIVRLTAKKGGKAFSEVILIR